VANASIFLTTTAWSGFGLSDPTWSVVMIGAATLIAARFYWQFADVAFVAVFWWAFWAIYQKQQEVPLVPETALVGILCLALLFFAKTTLKVGRKR
jgi:hypothetical protein